MPEFDALIFDCDGTLCLTADLHFHAFAAALAEQGAVLDRGWYQARTGLGRADLIAAFAADHGVALDVPALVAASLAATRPTPDLCRPHAPVAGLARRFAGRVPMAVASNAEGGIVRAVLAACGLEGLFSPVIGVTDAGVPKPDPAMFLMAARAMDTAPARCLVLEDSAEGLAAAARAGMAALDVRRADALATIDALG